MASSGLSTSWPAMFGPTCMVWNPFAVTTVEEAEKRLQEGFNAARKSCLGTAKPDVSRAAESFELIGRVPEDTIDLGRGAKAPQWYRQMTHINLPDAHIGYAIMDIVETGTKLQTIVR